MFAYSQSILHYEDAYACCFVLCSLRWLLINTSYVPKGKNSRLLALCGSSPTLKGSAEKRSTLLCFMQFLMIAMMRAQT